MTIIQQMAQDFNARALADIANHAKLLAGLVRRNADRSEAEEQAARVFDRLALACDDTIALGE